MPITIIPDTGVNLILVNADTGKNIILSGVSAQNSINISGSLNSLTPHNYLNGLQGGQSGQYYHLTSGEYSNLVTGVVTGDYYPNSNPSGYITGVDLSDYVTGEVVRPSDTGQFYPISNPSGYITGINQVSFVTLIPTGVEETGITFPYTFSSVPRVFADFALYSDAGYLVGMKNIAVTGYTAVFSDVIEETGLYLQTLATLT